jgi:hypothetical protein
LEDQRTPSRLETIFRSLVKHHLSSLLEAKKIYWRQINTVRWIKLGDENTNFFHMMATISHKRNFIFSLKGPDDSIFVDHEQKANIFFVFFQRQTGYQ